MSASHEFFKREAAFSVPFGSNASSKRAWLRWRVSASLLLQQCQCRCDEHIDARVCRGKCVRTAELTEVIPVPTQPAEPGGWGWIQIFVQVRFKAAMAM